MYPKETQNNQRVTSVGLKSHRAPRLLPVVAGLNWSSNSFFPEEALPDDPAAGCGVELFGSLAGPNWP